VLPPFFYPDDPRQIPALAGELAAANPAGLIAVGRYDDDVSLARALAAMPVEFQTVAAVAAPMRAFAGDLRERAEGWIGPSQWEPGARGFPDIGPSSAVFVDRFRERFGHLPDYPAAQAYAAGLILQHCVMLAGTCIDSALRRTAETLACRTFYGDFRLDAESGVQVGHETMLVQWQGGQKRTIWPARAAQAALVSGKPPAGS
jgi:ABC-type branched-subunit amino acid transport system substrate-binding protein